jgi:hypothetical protein
LLPRAVGGVEADMLITMGEYQICGTVVGTCPDDRACTGIASMEKQSPGDSTSCSGDSMHRLQNEGSGTQRETRSVMIKSNYASCPKEGEES